MLTWNQSKSDRFKGENIIIPRIPVWKTRLVEGSFPDRSFDIAFWQEQGDEAIFAAAWEMVELAEEISHGRKPTLPLQLLNECEVEYLLVGGFAVMQYGESRYTKDLDVRVHNSPQNSARIVGALRKFGAPLSSMTGSPPRHSPGSRWSIRSELPRCELTF